MCYLCDRDCRPICHKCGESVCLDTNGIWILVVGAIGLVCKNCKEKFGLTSEEDYQQILKQQDAEDEAEFNEIMQEITERDRRVNDTLDAMEKKDA